MHIQRSTLVLSQVVPSTLKSAVKVRVPYFTFDDRNIISTQHCFEIVSAYMFCFQVCIFFHILPPHTSKNADPERYTVIHYSKGAGKQECSA